MLAERNPHGRRHQRRRVVDPVADEHRLRLRRFPPDDRDLFFRGRAGVDLCNRHGVGQTPHFGLPISGDEQHAREPVLRPQVTDKPAALGARHVVEPKRRRVAVIDQDDDIPDRWTRWAAGRTGRPRASGS